MATVGIFFFLILLDKVTSIREIRIAHLLPMNANTNYEAQVMQMCIDDMKIRSILPKELNLKIFTMESCNRFSGVEHATYLHYIKNASVYFGPGCNNEMLTVGKLASRWNVPIIAHLSGDDALSDRNIYDTLGSVALTSATEMARATLTFLKLYGWKQVGFVKSSVNFDRLSLHSLKNLLVENGISINVEVEFDQFMTPEEIISSGQLKQLKNNARIIIVEMGLDLHTARNFMVAALRAGMNTNDFVYIIPWLAHLNDHYPWEASNINKDEVRQAFDDAILITAHGYDKKFIEDFKHRFSQLTGIVSSHYATLSYMTLYDALFLYGLALRDAYDETKNTSVYMDGKFIWNKMTARQFMGTSGQVLMNKKSIRVPSYATYLVKNGTIKIVVELSARIGDKQKCAISIDDCTEHVAHEILPHYWSSQDGSLPVEMPKCGFDGSLCDYSPVYITIGTIVFVVCVILLGICLYKKAKERELYDMTWRIPREQLKLLEHDRKSEVGSISTGSWTEGDKADVRISANQAICNGVKVSYKRFQQNRNLSFSKPELTKLKELKFVENENLNKFFGICFNQQNEFLVAWVLCQRGSLEDVIFNTDIKISRNFQISFAKDVVKGLYFLHNSPIKYHGLLCIQNCLVDSNWSIKLTNFGTEEIIANKLKHNEIRPFNMGSKIKKKSEEKEVEHNDKDDKERKRSNREQDDEDDEDDEFNINVFDNAKDIRSITDKKYLQQAPEIIRELINAKFLPPGSQSADIYALGMVLYQILFKLDPFYERDDSPNKIMTMIALAGEEDKIIRPTFPNQQTLQTADGEESYNLQLLSCIEACWLEIPEMRPNIKRIRTLVNANLKSTSSGTLVDQMMKMLEDYTTNLEQTVRSRTVLLEEAQAQADRLLKSMLPASIAEDLKVGKSVAPQLYASATILFSDIRGFTQISSTSTPFQVVNFLNEMFTGFDAIIAKHDAYKVETIGDAYMIASGLPRENGNAHVMHIAEVALKMRAFISNFKLAHRPEDFLMVRIGFHSGSVAAGVVGLTAPRYCLFGETVHMASRMESYGVPNKIQISKSSYSFIHCYYPQYIVEYRDKIEIKGKGKFDTWFLEGKNECDTWALDGASRK